MWGSGIRTLTKFLTTSALVLCVTTAMAAPSRAATTLDANWNTGCGATTCFDRHGVFTQTFSASDFGGPVTVDHLLMQRGVLGALDSHMFTISFALNGQEVGTWGDFIMGGIDGDVLTFTGQDFTWNPGDGDLELVLTLAPPPGPTLDDLWWLYSTFISDDPGPDPNPGSGPGSDPGSGGDAGGTSPPPPGGVAGAAVPEPAAWALMLGGFGMAGAALRYRRVTLEKSTAAARNRERRVGEARLGASTAT